MKNVAESLIMMVWILTLLAGTTYLVVTYQWSMWTYLLALLFMPHKSSKG